MKILYIYPTGLDNRGKPVKYKKAYLPPLSTAILDRLTPNKHKVNIVNDCVETIDFSVKYDLVGISSLTYQAPRVYQIAKRFKENGAQVVLGGIHPSLFPEEAIRYADAVVIGEAENIWEQVLSDAEKRNLQPLYRSSELPDLNEECIPKWHNHNLQIYRHSTGRRKMPRMPIFTTKGCVHNCKYCSVTRFFGRTYRFKPVSLILDEIDAFRADSYFFVDDNIVCKPEYSRELFTALRSRDIRWFSQSSVQILKHPKLIDIAAKAGCRSLFLGIESISNENLKSVRKSFNNPEMYLELIKRMEAVGIRPWISIILGFEHDDLEHLRTTVEFLKKSNVLNVVLFILTPLPGTELYSEMDSSGRIIERDWSKYDTWHVVYKPNNFTPAQLEREFWRIYKEIYSAGSIFKRTLDILKKPKINFSGFLNDVRIQFYTYSQLRRNEHPFSMGIGRKED